MGNAKVNGQLKRASNIYNEMHPDGNKNKKPNKNKDKNKNKNKDKKPANKKKWKARTGAGRRTRRPGRSETRPRRAANNNSLDLTLDTNITQQCEDIQNKFNFAKTKAT